MKRQILIPLCVVCAYVGVSTAEAGEKAYVSVEKNPEGQWSFSSAGERFFSLGVNHASESGLWMQDYNKDVNGARWGVQRPNDLRRPATLAHKSFMHELREQLRDWNFNTWVMHSPSVDGDNAGEGLYFTAQLRLMKYHPSMRPEDTWPDVFSSEFVNMVTEKAQQLCEEVKDCDMLLGLYFTDEPAWSGVFRRLPASHQWWLDYNPWVDAMRRLGPEQPGKAEWLKSLRRSYGTPAKAAEVYGTDDRSWEELAARTEWPIPSESDLLDRDVEILLAEIARRWYSVQSSALRKYLPNHLIFGDKHYQDVQPWLLPILRDHVDVVVIQSHGPFRNLTPKLRKIYEATGKPILIGDGAPAYARAQMRLKFPNGLYGKRYDEALMGELYANYLTNLLQEPMVIGFHHCGFVQTLEAPERKGFAVRTGFVDPEGQPHKEFVRVVKETNAKVARRFSKR